jgi:hypothetical protein
MKEGIITSPQPRPNVHLEVDSHLHFAVVKQLIKHIAISSFQKYARLQQKRMLENLGNQH